MALPPGFLDDLRARLPLSQVVGRRVTWDPRKSNPGRGDHWAPCPFHQEKTASFHVDDPKGYFYCFGCQAKGDAIGFVMQTENLGFMEAVEILAREVGMSMPARDPAAAQAADARGELHAAMEAAVQHYRLALRGGRAQAARDYLDRRGLGETTQTRFELGYAPEDRSGLTDALVAKGIPLDRLVEAGLTIRPDGGGPPRDRFRGRVMFPIRDPRGRAIAFGGRALDPGAPAKYLNSPETPLFDKGRTLYNHGPAREAAGKSGALIVAEGYVDVITLVEAGFAHAVAPLGTAITAEQLALIWRIADEPVIALDGDKAGRAAALRLIDLALPLLVAGKGLRFALLPQGQDPDDLIRAGGPAAMRAVLDAARPLVDLLWEREIEGRVFDSPERRATLDKALRGHVARIADPSIRTHTEAALRDRRSALLRPPARPRGGPARPWTRDARGAYPRPLDGPSPGARASILAQPGGEARVRECAILYGCLNHPGIAAEFEGALERIVFSLPDLGALRDALIAHLPDALAAPEPARALLAAIVADRGGDPRATLSIGPVGTIPHLAPGADPDRARAALGDAITRQRAISGLALELGEASSDDTTPDTRLVAAVEARISAERGPRTAADSATQDEESLAAHLQSLLDTQIWIKKSR